MPDIASQILTTIGGKNYQPVKPKTLARKLGVTDNGYPEFRKTLRTLVQQGQAEVGRNHTIRPARVAGTLSGVYRRVSSGDGFVRPVEGGADVLVYEGNALDAAPGDQVVVRVVRKGNKVDPPEGEVVRVVERASRRFVGTYFERHDAGFVRVGGTTFARSVPVGDPGSKGVKVDDQVVIEMVRFPKPGDRGEAVIVEVLGPRGQPGVDTLAVIRSYDLPDAFHDDVLEEAREQAAAFDETDLTGREDFTADLVITIDPADARDHDDAVSLTLDPDSGHWQLAVHIADVSHFAPPGGLLDREARKRGTSVYLPGRVLPMFPELISNGLASLQEGKVRYVKTVVMDYSPTGQRTAVRFANGAIKVRKRFSYEQVSAFLDDPAQTELAPELADLLTRTRDLAMLLRVRRFNRGSLELSMPEAELEYDEAGKVSGAHFAKHDVSHQIIEEFMLAANEAVAEHFVGLGVATLRRVHPAPDPTKLSAFGLFADSLGYPIERPQDRFSLQKLLRKTADKPERPAVHYAMLRSLKQASYSPNLDEHYALALPHYCHFTSPIRRYPDLVVHRQLNQWIRTKKARSDAEELEAVGLHCSKTERRADAAEKELVRLRVLEFLSDKLGMEADGVITGVNDYGLFVQFKELPADGLVHVRSFQDDFYYFDEDAQTLTARRSKRRFRLGDTVRVRVEKVDLNKRQLDLSAVERRRRS